MNLHTTIPVHRSDEFARRPAFWSTCNWLLNAGHPARKSINLHASVGRLRTLMNAAMGVYVFEETFIAAADHVGLLHFPVCCVERFAISEFALRDLEQAAFRRREATGECHAYRPYLSEHRHPPAGHWSLQGAMQ